MGQGGRLRVRGRESKKTNLFFKRPPARVNYVKERATAHGAMEDRTNRIA